MRGKEMKAISTIAVLLAMAAFGGGCGGGSSASEDESTAAASGQESIRGEGKLVQVEDGASISRETCIALKQTLSQELGEPVEADPRPKPERFSECGLRPKKGGLVVVYIDSTVPVRGRYLSRVNGVRKTAENAETRLHPVNGLGEGLDGEKGAYWLPSISSLYSYDEAGWLTLLYTLENESNAELRAGAEALGKRTFELTGQE